jgi:hypothetical protein
VYRPNEQFGIWNLEFRNARTLSKRCERDGGVRIPNSQFPIPNCTIMACPGFVDRLTLSGLFFSHDVDEALW